VVAKPTVLLVSAEASDRYIVGNTVEPRGYALQVVASADAGKRVLDQDREQIAVVVVDVGVPGARKLIQVSRSACPRARLVELRGPRETTQVSALLVNTVLN
jgi:CheY-like chemotaxis protein